MTNIESLTILSYKQAKAIGLKKYFTGIPCKYGHISERYIKTGNNRPCVECTRLDSSKRYRKDPDKKLNSRKDSMKKNPINWIYTVTRRRAKKKGVLFSLNIEDISMGETCPCCGDKFGNKGVGRFIDSTPTIDKLDPNCGYIKGNVLIICWRCNKIKNDSSSEELRMIANYIDKYKNPPAV